MITIQNEILKISINPKGAELDSVWHKALAHEFMWSGDATFWGKKSPVLFPIVGGLKENTYFLKGEKYVLPRHGFARDRVFLIEKQAADSVVFLLKSDAESRKVYPFDFEFRLHYTLIANTLSLNYSVKNTGDDTLYFSVGGHPAFRVPLVENTFYTDYFLQLNKKITAGRYPLSIDGLTEGEPTIFLENTDRIPLEKALFYQDAVVLKHWDVQEVSILSDKTPHGLRMTFEGFPYFGIWAAKNADFVCLEPWCGIADSVMATQDLTEKEGINALEANQIFERRWEISVF